MAFLAALLPACQSPASGSGEGGGAASAPLMGTAESYAVLAGSTVTNTGPTAVTGNLGVSPGTAVTGFPPGGVIGGSIHKADAEALQAESDTTIAYDDLAAEPCDATYGVPTDIGGLTLIPGTYCFSSSVQVTGALTLDAGGDPAAVFVFKTVSTLVTASDSSVLLINGAQQCNVFWKVGSSATIGTGTKFVGSILALTSIALQTDASLFGRSLARNGAVTMDSNVVTSAGCGQSPPTSPTLQKAFSPTAIGAGGVSTLTITLSNGDSTAAGLSAPLTDTLPAGMAIAGTATTDCGGTVATGPSSVTLTGGSIPAKGSCTVVVAVTAAAGGSYTNSIAAGALETGNGSNAAAARAILTVAPACGTSLAKSFAPATIGTNGVSTLILTLENSCSSAADLTAKLADVFPAGLRVAGLATTTCRGSVTTAADGSGVVLTGGSIPAHGSCTVTVDVTAAIPGCYCNTIDAGGLQTTDGSNAVKANAVLSVVAAPAP